MIEHASAAIQRREVLRGDRRAQYERLVEIRELEDRAQELFAQGKVHGTTHTCQGQEAVAVGIAAVTGVEDHVTCTYRGHGHALALGMTPTSVLGEIMGRTVGCLRGVGGSMHLCDPEVGLLPTFAIVGAGLPVAVGAALTADVTGTDRVAVAVFGDGATNIGAFHEALNLAAVWELPVVFVCENNLYGEYTPIWMTTPISDIADRAGAYGIPAEIVDGMDVDAVARSVGAAVERARSGSGPTLLEMKTYRFVGHSRSDTAPYRPDGELAEWRARDPIEMFGERLIREGELGESDVERVRSNIRVELDRVVEEVLASPQPKPHDMLRHVYVTEGPLR